MLQTLSPQVHGRYTSLPLLGPMLDEVATWLAERGYREGIIRVNDADNYAAASVARRAV